jgi:hypothetical protein
MTSPSSLGAFSMLSLARIAGQGGDAVFHMGTALPHWGGGECGTQYSRDIDHRRNARASNPLFRAHRAYIYCGGND